MPQPHRPPLNRPPDLGDFWQRTLEELEQISAAPQRRPVRCEDEILLEELSFNSLGGARIYGYLLRDKRGATRPLVVHGHGYGGQVAPMWSWARAGLDVCGIDVRGFGRSGAALAARSRWGYVLTGIEAPERHVLRGAVCDYLRGARVTRRALGEGVSLTVLYGSSFAGGLAVFAEAFGRIADLLVLAHPTFGWAEGRRFLSQAGSSAEINRFLARSPEFAAEDLMVVLRYFDPINVAERVRCPTLIGIGERDQVVPPHTVLAIAAHLGGPQEVMRFPSSHTGTDEERRQWEPFERRWIELALSGVPDGFGMQADA